MKKLFSLTMLCFMFTFACSLATAQSLERFTLPSIPYELQWYNAPLDYTINDGNLTITGGPGSRLYVDPTGNSTADTGPIALFVPDETFTLSSDVEPELAEVFDAGVLMLFGDDTHWAKFCFEYSVERKPILVTVVNNGVSDDADHFIIDGKCLGMRLSSYGNGIYAMHFFDGNKWHMARYFKLGFDGEIRAGFMSQSPRGEKCTTHFKNIKYTAAVPPVLRSGE